MNHLQIARYLDWLRSAVRAHRLAAAAWARSRRGRDRRRDTDGRRVLGAAQLGAEYDVRGFVGDVLLALGLLLTLASLVFMFGLGLTAGLLALASAQVLIAGVALRCHWTAMLAFVVGAVASCLCPYALATGL